MIGYIDPSVMTYLVQAIAGVVIAVVAFFGIYYRKAKKKVSDKLGIDENRNKEVESDEIVVNDEKEVKEEVVEEEQPKKNTAKKTTNKPSTKTTTKKTTNKKTNNNKTKQKK